MLEKHHFEFFKVIDNIIIFLHAIIIYYFDVYLTLDNTESEPTKHLRDQQE